MASSDGLLTGGPSRRSPARRILVAVAAVLLLALAVLGGAGWYYAGEIGDEALTVRYPSPGIRYDLEVVAVEGPSVVLRRTGEPRAHDPLPTDAVFGLRWSTGRGVLSGPARTADGGVERSLRVTRGVAPEPGSGAALAQSVWDDPTEAYGVSFVEVAYPCLDAQCPAWYVAGTSSTWFVAVHGKGGTLAEQLRVIGPAIQAGLPVLDIGYRNDVASPRDPSGRYGYGTTEWRDLEAAVARSLGRGAQRVVLAGASMGGAIVAAFLEHSDLASVVSGVVLDSPALDLRAAVESGAAERTLPVLGTGLPDVLTATAEQLAAWRYDLDWDAVDYVPGDWLRVPALVLHGTADATVPITTSEELARAHPDLVDLERFAGATHVESWNSDPERYTAAQSAFLSCVTAPAPPGTCTG